MGIEPMGSALPSLQDKRFGENADAKCDLRVNFGGTRGNAGLRRLHSRERSRAPAFSRRSLNDPLRPVGSGPLACMPS